MVAHTYNPSIWEGEAEDHCEFETILGYKVS